MARIFAVPQRALRDPVNREDDGEDAQAANDLDGALPSHAPGEGGVQGAQRTRRGQSHERGAVLDRQRLGHIVVSDLLPTQKRHSLRERRAGRVWSS